MTPRSQQRRETAAVPRPRRPAKEEEKATAEKQAEPTTEEEVEHRGGLTLPVVHTTLRPPQVGLPGLSSVPGRVLWLGGLGAFAALGAIDWPVAIAIASGTYVAEQRAKERLRQEAATRSEDR